MPESAPHLELEPFVTALRESRVAVEERINPILAAERGAGVLQLAGTLVKRGILNDWQAEYLQSGQTSLRIGNYLLTGRSGFDSLGERFTATQESLHRVVDLQILPASLTADAAGMDRFLHSARKLTQLDHHAILHLFDVAEHKGRIFIVSEHCEAIGEDELRSAPDAGLAHLKIARDLCSAVGFLHQNSLSHGFLGAPQSIRLKKPGLIKIDQLAWSVLQREMISRSLLDSVDEVRRADWNETGKFLAGLFAEAKPDEALSDANRLSLVSAFSGLAASPDPAARAAVLVEKISLVIDRVEKRPLAATAAAPPDRPGQTAAAASPLHAEPGSAPRPAASRPAAGTVLANAAGTGRTLPSHPRARSLKPTLISLASLVCLTLLVGWFGWDRVFGPVKPAVKKAGGRNHSVQSSNSGRADPDRRTKNGDQAQTDPLEPVREGNPAAPTDPADGPPGLSDSSPLTAAAVPDRSSEMTPVASEIRAPENTGLSVGPETGNAFAVTPASSGNMPLPDGHGESPANSDPTLLSPAADSAPPVQDPVHGGSPEMKPADPKAQVAGAADEAEKKSGLPGTFDLKPGIHEPQVLGFLNGATPGNVTLSLEHDPESNGRGRNFFVIQPRSDRWEISWSRKSATEELEPVATLELDSQQQLVFRWSDSVDDKHPANALINSILATQAGVVSYRTVLRQPVEFEGLSINAENLQARSNVDIAWLPRAETIRIEFGELDDQAGWTAQAILEPTTDSRQPTRVYFGTLPEERLLWLAMETRVRTRFEQELSVETLANGKFVSLKPKDLEALINGFVANKLAMDANVAQCEALLIDPPYGTKGKREDALKAARKTADAARNLATLAYSHQTWLQGIAGRPIPVRLIYPVGEQSIELARSAGWNLTEPAPAPAESGSTSKKSP